MNRSVKYLFLFPLVQKSVEIHQKTRKL